MQSVWCAKHRDGWCAAKTNEPWDERAFNVPTMCGYFVTLPIGCKKGEPTCLECLEILDQRTADRTAKGFLNGPA
jgi:hypothetical protein